MTAFSHRKGLDWKFFKKLNILKGKDNEGKKTLENRLQRVDGWCKSITIRWWIAHPGVAVLRRQLVRNGRFDCVIGRDLVRGRRGCRATGTEKGWYRDDFAPCVVLCVRTAWGAFLNCSTKHRFCRYKNIRCNNGRSKYSFISKSSKYF